MTIEPSVRIYLQNDNTIFSWQTALMSWGFDLHVMACRTFPIWFNLPLICIHIEQLWWLKQRLHVDPPVKPLAFWDVCFDYVFTEQEQQDPDPPMCSNTALFPSWQDECYNYIKVLVPRNDETLFACGTNAFNPTCRNYKVEFFSPFLHSRCNFSYEMCDSFQHSF